MTHRTPASSAGLVLAIAALALTCSTPAPEPQAPLPERRVGETLRTPSGLEITQLRAGFGDRPNARSSVRVHYHGTLADGTVFDSSVDRGQPSSFALDRVIRCWTEGLQLMRSGDKSRLVCPSRIAYGSNGSPPKIPPNATLTFEIELLEVL